MQGFYKNYKNVIQNEKLTRTQQVVLGVILDKAKYYKGKQFYCYEEWIAAEVRCSRRTVIRAIKRLEELEIIVVKKNYNKTIQKTTNYYSINNNAVNNGEENMVNNTITEIANKQFKTVKNEKEVVSDEILSNVKKCLKKGVNKKNEGIVYLPGINKSTGYDYSTILKAVEVLNERGDIEYTPNEKDGKIYHNYSISIKGTIKEWEQICIAAYGQSRGDMDYLNKVSMYNKQFVENGIDNKELIKVMMNVLNKYGNKKLA